MMKQDKLDEIFRMAELSARSAENRIGDAEKAELEAWAARSESNRRLLETFMDQDKRDQALKEMRQYNAVSAWQQVQPKMKVGRSAGRRRMAAAAVIALLLGSAYLAHYKVSNRDKVVSSTTGPSRAGDVPPGGIKATLILANGSSLQLGNRKDSTFRQGASMVVQQPQGSIAYNPTAEKTETLQYNTLITPRGGEYSLVLADGTRVWLNAASSLRYPTAFAAGQRNVQLAGEAYFEVAPGLHPFTVSVGQMEVKVLGTHFNVNAYPDETAVATTLLEGKVRVSYGPDENHSLMIEPGEQARLGRNGQISLVKDADVDEVMAWKNGLFVFHNDDLPSIMRRLARWYNVDVEYENGHIPAIHFTGAVRRQENISKILKMLELTGGTRYSIDGNRIIVTN